MTGRNGWGRTLAVAFAIMVAALVVVLTLAWSALPLDHTTLIIDGETVSLSGFDGWRGALAILAAVVAVVLGLLVAVLAVVVGLGFAALGVAIALAAVLATLALVTSPLLFIGWLIWLLVRPARPSAIAA